MEPVQILSLAIYNNEQEINSGSNHSEFVDKIEAN